MYRESLLVMLLGIQIFWYIQDETAGIAVFSADFASAVTKRERHYYLGKLLSIPGIDQLDPVSDFTVHSSLNILA